MLWEEKVVILKSERSDALDERLPLMNLGKLILLDGFYWFLLNPTFFFRAKERERMNERNEEWSKQLGFKPYPWMGK